MHTNIEELIPHRAPFLFVDEIISISDDEIVAVKTFERDPMLKDSFPENGFVPGTILLESMAQAGGAGVRLLGVTDGIFALAQIESAEFFGGAGFDVQVTYNIKNIRLGEKIIKQSGQAFANGKMIMQASWMSIKIDERKHS